MSLMKTLAKVAVGVALAKGAGAVMKRNQQGGDMAQSGGLGGLLGGLTGGTGTAQAGGTGGLQDMLGGLLGGGAAGGGLSQGGLGGLLESLGGAQTGGAGAQGGLGGLLGGLAGAAGAGGLLGGLGGALGSGTAAPAQNEESFGAVLNSQFDQTPEPAIAPTQDQEAVAALMLSAMIQAAKSDGNFDEAEKEKLLGHLGEIDAEEAAFVQAQLQAPVDIDTLVANTPKAWGSKPMR